MSKTRIAIALTATLIVSPVLATEPQRSAVVRTGDLDLSKPADVRTLNRRVAVAKQAACGSYAGARDGDEDRIAQCRASIDRQIEVRLASR